MNDLKPDQYIFVEHSHGSFKNDAGELVEYDNVILSDGLRAMKVKRPKELSVFGLKKGDIVNCSFTIEAGKKDALVARLASLEPVK